MYGGSKRVGQIIYFHFFAFFVILLDFFSENVDFPFMKEFDRRGPGLPAPASELPTKEHIRSSVISITRCTVVRGTRCAGLDSTYNQPS